jgi:hypothetical protein
MATAGIHPPRRASAIRALQADRVIGIVGALTVVIATWVAWYSAQLTVTTGGLVNHVTSDVSLWHVRNLAAWLITLGAGAGIASLLLPIARQWRGGIAAAVMGFGIAVYSLVAIFDVPDLGSAALVGSRVTAVASTALGAGPFVALLGGLLLLAGGIAASRRAP